MSHDADLAARVRRVLASRADVVEKRMFGGVCFMVRGHMCCGVTGTSLMVRLPPNEADAVADEPHVRPMDFTGRPMRGFLFVDADGLATASALRVWVERTTRFASTKPVKRPAAKPSRPTAGTPTRGRKAKRAVGTSNA